MYKLIATAILLLCTATTFVIALDDDGNVVDVTRQRTRRMRDVSEREEQVAASTQEAAVPAASEEQPEFRGINEITVIKSPVAEAPAVPAEEKEEEEAVKKSGNMIGMRMGFGNTINIGAIAKFGVSEANRIDIGGSAGFGFGRDNYRTWAFEFAGFYDWRFAISDELSWYIGPGVAFGRYGVSGHRPDTTTNTQGNIVPISIPDKRSDYRVGVGGQVGLEVDLSFIDPDHSLYTLKDMTICLDIRPMVFYWPNIPKYPRVTFTVGLSFKYDL